MEKICVDFTSIMAPWLSQLSLLCDWPMMLPAIEHI